MPAATGERNLHEAFHHGCAVIAAIVAATFALVLGIMGACGCDVQRPELLGIAGLLLLAGYCEFRARLARTRR